MKKNYLLLLFFAVCKTAVFAQLAVTATQVAGTCSKNAQINVTGSGGTAPYEFRLTAGAAGTSYPTPFQAGTNFSGLAAGNYTVQVKDNVGATATKAVTVTTSYVNLAITTVPVVHSVCPATGGSATINRSGGLAPFTYALLSGVTPVYGPQPGNVFTGVAPGNYNAQVQDACGEIRTFAVTVQNNDYKWQISNDYDNHLITPSTGFEVYAPTPFDTTVFAHLNDGPLLFTCDSIAFRLLNRLGSTAGTTSATMGVPRRVYIRNLDDNTIAFDLTYIPNQYASNAPSVHLKTNTNYRFYFDDLCNDVDFIDRNYSINRENAWTINSTIRKTCEGFGMTVYRNTTSNWNSKNRYNNPYDTITIISSTLAGDTMVGKQIKVDMILRKGLNATFYGITPGHTYQVEVKNSCNTYIISRTYTTVPSINFTASVQNTSCVLNTAGITLSPTNFPVDSAYYYYTIHSGPASFTDAGGTTHTITYPITDKELYPGFGSYLVASIRNLPQGTYSISMADQCGNNTPVKDITIGPADVLQVDGYLAVNQQCPGASSVTFNRTLAQRSNVQVRLERWTGATWTITGIANSTYTYQDNSMPATTSWNALNDGMYRVNIVPLNSTIFHAAPLPFCQQTLWADTFVLQYQLAVIDTAAGFVCTAGGNDGKVTLFPNLIKGLRPFQFQMIDGAGNPLTPYQSDSIFTGLSKGSYNFRIKDNCGNATIYSYQVDTLKKPGILPSTTCPLPGNPFTLTADSVYQASYTWTFTPAGGGSTTTVSTNRALHIATLTPADYGTYVITYSIPGCGTSKSTQVTIGNCAYVLPIGITSFNARIINCKTELQWLSATETNLSNYIIEYSENGTNFTAIGTVPSKGSNFNYSYLHQPPAGKAFYRLRITDIEGKVTFSKTLYLHVDCNGNSKITVYPNPVKDKVTVTGLKGNSHICLLSVLGQELSRVKTIHTTYEVDLSNYPKGTYMLQVIESNRTAQTIKLSKE